MMRPAGRRTPKPDTHSLLKTAAAEVFATRSYRATAVDDIVEQAGTSRGSFYYYFTSKADVARDLQEELWGAAARQADQVVDPEADFLTNARRGLEAYLAALKDFGAERAFLSEGFVEPTLAMFDDEGKKWGGHFIRDRLVDAMDRGEIPRQDPDQAARLLVEALQTLTLAALQGADVTGPLGLIEDLNRALTSGPRATETASPGHPVVSKAPRPTSGLTLRVLRIARALSSIRHPTLSMGPESRSSSL